MEKITQYQAKTQNNKIESKWLTLQEAAEYLKLNKRTLANYVSKRLVPVHISVVGGKRFCQQELDAWVSNTKQGFSDF